jgi:hypothetical protein
VSITGRFGANQFARFPFLDSSIPCKLPARNRATSGRVASYMVAATREAASLGRTRMLPRSLDDRLTALINDLLLEDSLSTSLLASILLNAQESVKDGMLVPLALQLWKARKGLLESENESLEPYDATAQAESLERQVHSPSWPTMLAIRGKSRTEIS